VIVRGGVHNHPSTHAVPGNGYTMRVNAEPRGVPWIAEICEHGVGILEVLTETEHAGAAPRTAIIESDGIPPCAPDSLREIEIFFVAGQAVADDESGVRPSARGLVDDAIDEHAVSWDMQDSHFSRVSGIGGWVGEDGRRNGLGGDAGRGKSCEDYEDAWAHE
jgi:hypothetical protein